MFGNIENQGNELKSKHHFLIVSLPGSDSTARQQPVPRKSGDFMEAVLLAGEYSDFSGVFRPAPEVGIIVLGGGDL